MSGYLDMPEETARAIRDGWFWGGDLARMDSGGYLYLAGRSKDMIIRAGENIYPIEVETVISDYPGVTAVAVVGQPDDHWGEIVVAFLTAAAGRRHRAGRDPAVLPGTAGVLQDPGRGHGHWRDAAERQREDPQAGVAGPAGAAGRP